MEQTKPNNEEQSESKPNELGPGSCKKCFCRKFHDRGDGYCDTPTGTGGECEHHRRDHM